MEISKSLENAAVDAIESQESVSELIPVEGTPFFLSLDGKRLIVHGIVAHEEKNYYIGTLDPANG